MKNFKNIVLIGIVVISIILLLKTPDLQANIFLEYRVYLESKISESPIIFGFIAFFTLVICGALCLPFMTILVLGNGFFMGLGWGTIVTSIGSTLGAVISFVISRYFLRSYFSRKFHKTIEAVNTEFSRHGVLYVLSLRTIPLIPYSIINIVFGVTNIRLSTFFWGSQLGMLPIHLILVNAGTQISKVNQLVEIFSPKVIGSLIMVGLVPLCVRFVKHHRASKAKNK